jgi:hypothetical protein
MSNLSHLTALALPTGSRLVADETESRLHLSLEGQPLIQLRLTRAPELHVQVEERFGTLKPIGPRKIASRRSMTPAITTAVFTGWRVKKITVARTRWRAGYRR